jgi:hypothetical protein
MMHDDDRRRPTRNIEEVGDSKSWYMVSLNAPLGIKGYVAATVLVPKATTDAQIADPTHLFSDEWKLSSRVIRKVWNGFTPAGTIGTNKRCKIELYYGRWIVTQVEC